MRTPAACDRGAVAVEFAIIVPVFLLIVLFAIDAGRVLYVQISLLNASNQGARAASLGMPAGSVVTVVQSAAPGAASMSGSGATSVTATVDTACPALVDPTLAQMAEVSASVDYAWFTPLALVQVFAPTSTRPDQVTLSATSEWLCAN